MPTKTGKRALNGTGSIRKRTVNRGGKDYTYWEARITVGRDPITGSQRQKTFSGKTQREVREKMQAAAVEVNNHTYRNPSKMTYGEWLDIWAQDYLNSVKPKTRRNYAQHIKNHIKPALGGIKLDELTAPDIQRFYNQLRDHGGKRRKHDREGNIVRVDGETVYEPRPLSAKTVKNIHGVVHRSLEQAVRVDFIRSNPADACDLPKAPRTEITPMDNDDIARFIEAIKGHRYETFYLVTLFSGMRRGEACGLKWDCVDLERGAIIVKRQLQNVDGSPGEYELRTTKNNRARTIFLAPSVTNLLKRHRAAQLEMRVQAGPVWEDTGFVFCKEDGTHLSPSTVYHNYKKIVASIGNPNLRVHDLRHTYAVVSLQAGDDIKTVQGNLGHQTASFTLDVYGHVTDQMKNASAERMDAFIKQISGQQAK